MGGSDYSAVGARAVDTVLEHHGVKGMKWGVRKNRGGSSGGSSSGKPQSEDHKVVSGHKETVKKHGTSALSNKELGDLVTRLNLEQQYGRLTTQSKHKGVKFVTDLLASVGKQQVSKLASDALSNQISKQLKGGK